MEKEALQGLPVSLIVEGYTYAEVGGFDRFRQSLGSAVRMQQDGIVREVLLIDTAGRPELIDLLREFPTVSRVEAIGMKYDDGKMRAAEQASGEFVLYLDGDCLPGPGWPHAHLAALVSGEAQATGGFTRYDGGFLSAIYTILDFGFLLPRKSRRLGCYASNNSGFRRSLLLARPMLKDGLRCNCYAHAQFLQRSGNGMLLVPDAAVRHAVQPFFIERFRQGFDAVGACWVNPALPETRFLRLGVLAAPLFYGVAVWRDFRRLLTGYRDLDLAMLQVPFALPLFPLFRLVDFAGMLRALVTR
jgi:hypothetical protein